MSISNEEIFKLLQEVAKSVNDTRDELVSFKREVRREIDNIKKENLQLKQDIESFKTRLLIAERKQKKYNLVVYGIKEDEAETKQKLLHILNTTLNINCLETEIRDIYRIGKTGVGKVRPTIVEFLHYQVKAEILKKSKGKSKKLREIGIGFSPDLINEDYLKNKFLYSQAKSAREKGLSATVKNFSLIVNGETYSYEQLMSSKSIETDEEAIEVELERSISLPSVATIFNIATQDKSEQKRSKAKDSENPQAKYTLRDRKGSGSK